MKIKNNKEIEDTWVGMTIQPDAYYTITPLELIRWQNDSKVLIDLSNSDLIINDESADITDIVLASKYLQAKSPIEIIPASSVATPDGKIQKVSVYKAEGSSSTKVTHDWTDKCTWFQASVKVTDETLTLVSGKTYSSVHTFWIDAIHGRIYGEDELTINDTPLYYGGVRKYKVEVKDNGTLLVEDTNYTVNYDAGTVTLSESYTIVGSITATYNYATNGTYTLGPTSGKIMVIEHAELQFSKDIQFTSPINFEIWVYHPNQVTYPGVKVLYQKITYKNIRDIINAANLGQGSIPAVAGLQNDILVFPFNYATVKPFRYSLGAELRITINTSEPLPGEWGTATFYILSLSE